VKEYLIPNDKLHTMNILRYLVKYLRTILFMMFIQRLLKNFMSKENI